VKIIQEAVIYDDHQVCSNPACHWSGSKYDEPFHVCPICCHGLRVESWGGKPFQHWTPDELIARTYRHYPEKTGT
jgi:hypothetical protein